MARKPSVRYWPSRKGYGVTVNGHQYILAVGPDDCPTGPTYIAALGAFPRLTDAPRIQGRCGPQPPKEWF